MRIKARVKTGARKEETKEISSNRLEISVRQKPVENAANKRVIELVARHFHIPVGKVRIISGHRSPSKTLSINTG